MAYRILIVEDHAVVRRMLKALVETHEGWEVCWEAENGVEAIAKAEQYQPDLIIMDMAMPVKDGISASREISSKAPAVPIVMHTLHYSPELELEAKKAGVRAVVRKAEGGDDLLNTIEKVLNKANGAGTEIRPGEGRSGDLSAAPPTQADEATATSEAPPQDLRKAR
jgi:DNA-binding NarL/FixJ family response regulator